MPRGKRNPVDEQPEEEIVPDVQAMTPEEYMAFLQAKAADVNLQAEERLYAMREIGRLNAKG